MRVAVTRLKEKDNNTRKLFSEYGFDAVVIPTIRSREPEDLSSLELLVERTENGDVDILIFTSSLGVTNFFKECKTITPGIRIIGVGPKTAEKVNEYGHPCEILDSFSSDNFASYLKDRAHGRMIGIARAGVPNPELIQSLESLGAEVVEGVCYELEEVSNELKKALIEHRVDAVIFTSAKSFLAAGLDKSDVKNVITVAIGPKTADAMENEGMIPDIAGSGTLESCAELLQKINKN